MGVGEGACKGEQGAHLEGFVREGGEAARALKNPPTRLSYTTVVRLSYTTAMRQVMRQPTSDS